MAETCNLFTHEQQGRRSLILPCTREAVATVTLLDAGAAAWWHETRTTEVRVCALHLVERDE